MTLTLELSPQEEARLREKAARQGQDAENYAVGILRQDLSVSQPAIISSRLTPEEIQRLRQESLERAAVRNLPASSSDFRREDIYNNEEGR